MGPIGRVRALATGPWLKAPLLLLRYPGLLLAVASSILILSMVSAAGPLFLSSAGNASLHESLADACPWDVGWHLSGPAPLSGRSVFGGPALAAVQAEERILDQSTAGIADLGPRETFALGSSVSVRLTGASHAGEGASVRLSFRDDALDHVKKLSNAGGTGVWLADTVARAIGARAGDRIRLETSSAGIPTRVQGIYADLVNQPRAPFWCLQEHVIYPLSAFASFIPPPLAFTDRETFIRLGSALEDRGSVFTWDFEPKPGIDLPAARALGVRLRALTQEVREPLLRAAAQSLRINARLPILTDLADETVTSLRGSIETVALAGRLVALLVLAVAGAFWVERRRSEVTLLAAKGAGPVGVWVKVVLETALPAVAAGVVGLAAARWLVGVLGPDRFDGTAASSAARQAAWSAAAGALLLALVAAFVARRILESNRSAAGRVAARAPWEAVALTVAGAALYEILTRGVAPIQDANVPSKIDRLVLLFPIMFVAGAAGVLVRLLRRVLPRLSRAGSGWRTSRWFAIRRLAAASGAALNLVVAAAVASGILVYAGALSASVAATSRAKASVFTGSDVAITFRPQVHSAVEADRSATAALASFAHTTVERVDRAVPAEGGSALGLLGVDRSTFAGAAFWDPTFADRSLADLLADLAPPPAGGGGPIPVLAAGGSLPGGASIRFPSGAREPIPIRVVDEVRTFPGLQAGSVLVVMDRATLESLEPPATYQVWVRGPPAAIDAAVRRSALPAERSVSVDDVQSTPQFRALSWTFGFLQALGILAGLVALGGALLHLEARQRAREVAYALTRRMGLTRSANRGSIAYELASILGLGLVFGAGLAWIAAWLVAGRIDPFPRIPPPPLFRLPLALILLTALAVLAASWAGAWQVQRAADRARVAEVLRAGT
jgi:putative ABC transport system permease protein